ncbi:MAG: DUF72 domain-containing protein [Azospira oryzae]|jgi:uncharacterized protein YecE (DUF72 family)|nr:MAG: DUF72 domain-containing protein [Azospira oryzae]
MYYSGISGLQLPVPKYQFPAAYQSSSRLTYYSSLFNSIEINSSFYKIPLGKTVLKWSNEVPADFRFTFKLWKGITHLNDLIFNASDVVHFMDVISAVGAKRGVLLVQFPPGLKSVHSDQLIRLLKAIKQSDPKGLWPVAVEFRNQTWYQERIYHLADEHRVSIVVHDKMGSSTRQLVSSVTTVYLRFHGPQGDYRGDYSSAFLREYAGYVRQWLEAGKNVYVYFNNTIGGAIASLQTFSGYVAGKEYMDG